MLGSSPSLAVSLAKLLAYNEPVTTNLLQTKMFIPPPRPDFIARPQLLEHLDQGLRKSRSLTLVSAPAGYGKSTMVVSWIHERHLSAAWLAVDVGDNDPARFFAYLAAALRRHFPDAAAELDAQLSGLMLGGGR